MGVEGSYTDFHIDFGGSSVWYHMFKVRFALVDNLHVVISIICFIGRKNILPCRTNAKKFESLPAVVVKPKSLGRVFR